MLALASETLESTIEVYLKRGQSLPEPRAAAVDEADVVVSPTLAARVMLHGVMRRRGLTQVALAQLMSTDEHVARCAYTGQGASLELILNALRATGQGPVLTHDLFEVDVLATEIKVAAHELWRRIFDCGVVERSVGEALTPYLVRAGEAQAAAVRTGFGAEWEQVRNALQTASQIGAVGAIGTLVGTVADYQRTAYPSRAYLLGCGSIRSTTTR